MIEIGLKSSKTTIVTAETTAEHMLSGQLPVYATPSLIAFVEYTCEESVRPFLDEGFGTVGTLVNIRHLAASPIGAHIRCESELIEIGRKRLVFAVKVYDDIELVGEGRHERFIIANDRFMSRIEDKLSRLAGK